ncbi:MAG: DUF2997 domain-containing protein [Deltaproteobacteria bacterium]|nr:DUF2997 domain-containing protein [Deltaproteobacteria bacterium]
MKEVIVEIKDDGEIRIETCGFKGKECITETEFLKKVLGKETSRNLTPAYWQENHALTKKYLPICG